MSLQKFREKMQAKNLDAFLITQEHNRHYLSGFTGSAGVLLITPDKQFLLTDSRYYEQVGRQSPEWELVKAGYKIAEQIAQLIIDLNLADSKIGFEADQLTVSQFEAWQKAMPDANLVSTTGFAVELRAVKTPAELEAIKKAVALSDEAMVYMYRLIQPGMTEKEVAWELEVFMRTRGADALSFDTIVAAGANAALPHAVPGDYEIESGDVVLIDMGCMVDGYCSDITRTFSLGQPIDEQYLDVWQIVNRANDAAIAGIKAGISGRDGDALARDIIVEAGFGDNFGHSLGHGVGLFIHEEPRVSFTSEAPLPEGSVITIEPGIYLPGQFGVRIEDAAVVTATGVEVLSTAPKIDVLPR